MLKKLTILFNVSLIVILLLTGCVSQYKYFPAEPIWASNPTVLADTNGIYWVNSALVSNYVYQILYLEQINDWRKNNGVP